MRIGSPATSRPWNSPTGSVDGPRARLSRTTAAQRRHMWALYIAGEYGGMNESPSPSSQCARVTRPCSTAARYFDNEPLLANCAVNRDVLNGKHANQHVPQFLGYSEDVRDPPARHNYFTATQEFLGDGRPRRRSIPTAASANSRSSGPGIGLPGGVVGSTNAETCAAYNMIKLSRRLFHFTGDVDTWTTSSGRWSTRSSDPAPTPTPPRIRWSPTCCRWHRAPGGDSAISGPVVVGPVWRVSPGYRRRSSTPGRVAMSCSSTSTSPPGSTGPSVGSRSPRRWPTWVGPLG